MSRQSGMSNLAVVIVSAVVLAGVAFFLVAVNSGYDSRRHVQEAMKEAEPLKARIVDFHDRNKSLPQVADVAKLRQEQRLKRARSVEWDPAGRVLVVTMDGQPYPGKRFGWIAQVGDGSIDWTCRRLDIEAKFLPAACR